jgi:hypothetical protein
MFFTSPFCGSYSPRLDPCDITGGGTVRFEVSELQ